MARRHPSSSDSPRLPLCPVCLRPITAADRVSGTLGRLMHEGCDYIQPVQPVPPARPSPPPPRLDPPRPGKRVLPKPPPRRLPPPPPKRG